MRTILVQPNQAGGSSLPPSVLLTLWSNATSRQVRARYVGLILFSLALIAPPFVSGQGATTQTEQNKLIRAPDALGVLGDNLFGDKLNFYDGSLEFIQTDINIPGNSKLPVVLGRRLTTGNKNLSNGMFREWNLEIPHIHATFSRTFGWQRMVDSQPTTRRCTNFGAPPDVVSGYDTYRAFEYWHGNYLYVPGAGNQEILRRNPVNTNIPADGQATPLVTKGDWAIRCLASLASNSSGTPANEGGEGFLAISPDGTQYRFDWLVTTPTMTLSKPSTAQPSGPPDGAQANGSSAGQLPGTVLNSSVTKAPVKQVALPKGVPQQTAVTQQGGTVTDGTGGVAHFSLLRDEVWIYPTLVTDRFGNTVRYNYDTVVKNKLLSIVASDGRSLTFSHEVGTNVITSATDGIRTWTYTYGVVDSGRTMLTTVTLPDGSAWQLGGLDGGRDIHNIAGLEGLVQMEISYKADADSPPPYCDQPGDGLDGRTAIGTMIHPSGAIGTFTMQPTRHGRNGVPLGCYSNGTNYGAPYYPAYIDSYSMTEKVLSGPGLPTMTWTNNYDGTDVGAWSNCGAACIQPAVVLSTNPAGEVTRYTFGATYAVDEGILKQTDIGWNGSTALRSTSTRLNRSFNAAMGFSDQDRGDNWVTTHRLPEDQRLIVQQGTSFTWQVPADSDFDSFARPKKVIKFSSQGSSRTEVTAYADNLAKWVLGQIESVTEQGSGREMVRNAYNVTTANLESISHFGQVDSTLSYNADGTLLTKRDGKGQATIFSNYKRGIPQNVRYPDNTSESGVVNGYGAVVSHTDQNGNTTVYEPDAMGRLAKIIHPAADSVAWNATSVVYQQVQNIEFDLGPGHWRQDVTTGNGRMSTYYDALWRPVYVQASDLSDVQQTSRITKRGFDFAGRTVFESYPKRDHASIGSGKNFHFDALGRTVRTESNSELGLLVTTTTFDDGFRKTTTDARNNVTTTGYQVFDEPVETAMSSIAAPEGVTVNIDRDLFGKARSITRSGGGKSLTRSYVYDARERLCKTIEPETGATVQEYDLANNVQWRASGLGLPATNTCDTASVAAAKKMTFGYDALNRLSSTTFGDSSPSIGRTYTADGLPDTISSDGAVWTNSYNKRRLHERESLTYGGAVYNISRSYDANGSLAQLTYPDGAAISYNPNGLGEPRQVGNYASAVTYHPNGAIRSFTYGNGIVHSLELNERMLPRQSIDYGAINDVYSYDANANVAAIADMTAAGINSRSMLYDNLDRLKVVSAPRLWGTATYAYDALDNLTDSALTGGITARTLRHTVDPANNRISSTSGGSADYNFSYGYDSQGNITQRGSQAYLFDQANRLKRAVGKATYLYDGLGHRVSVVGTDGVNRVQVYTQAGQLLYVTPTSGPGATKYIYLHNHVIAEVKK